MTWKEKAEHLKFYRKGLHNGNPFFCFTNTDYDGWMLSVYIPYLRVAGITFKSYKKGKLSIVAWRTAKNGNHVSRSLYTNHYKV
jgi:hypothetical protein